MFHCARYFDTQGWHVKNPRSDEILSFFVLFLAQWIMPLFFILSGISTYYMLSYRKTGQFIKSRFTRLLVPFIFGTLTLIPPQVYIERVSQHQFTGSFFEFYPRYFDGFYAFGGNFAWMGLHLWYLQMLFVYSLRALNSWFWLIAIFGFAGRHFTTHNRFLGYANEAVLPFYILHQTIIVTIGFYIIDWSAGVYFKFLVLCVASFGSICIIYELLVRRISILRFLFGLKLRR